MSLRAPPFHPLIALIAIAILSMASAGMPFQTVDRGDSSGVEEAVTKVFRTRGGFRLFWARHRGYPVPAVDFSREMVVAVFRGQQASAGFDVEITSVNLDPVADKLVVNFLTRDPPPGDQVSTSGDQVSTSVERPYHIIKLLAYDQEVSFAGAAEPMPPPETRTYMLALDEGAEEDGTASALGALPGVTGVKVARSTGLLFVNFTDDGSVGKPEARRMLEDVDGVRSIEKEYVSRNV